MAGSTSFRQASVFSTHSIFPSPLSRLRPSFAVTVAYFPTKESPIFNPAAKGFSAREAAFEEPGSVLAAYREITVTVAVGAGFAPQAASVIGTMSAKARAVRLMMSS